MLLNWLREDKVISSDDAVDTARRFSSSQSAQHPITRLASAGLARVGSNKPLDAEAITEWLAKRTGIAYLRIDPLKADVGRVSEIMSINYAERRRALPLNVGTTEVTIATCEPLDIGWVAEIEGHTRKSVKLVLVSPLELTRYTTEFYTLSRSVRNATKTGEVSAAASWAAPTNSSTPTTRAWSRSSTGCGSTRSTSGPRTSTSSRAASAA
jgi:general secretion pathway protein E